MRQGFISVMRTLLSAVIAFLSTLSICSAEDKAFQQNARLSHGINLSGYFDGDVVRMVGREDIRRIKQIGFRSVRLPVQWTKHIAGDTIEPSFLASVRQVVEWCLEEDLAVALNVHHFNEMNENPDQYEDFLVALWRMLSVRFADFDDRLMFELLNEPNKALTVERWNYSVAKLHTAIREQAPSRTLIVGSAEYNGWWTLDRLKLPEDDRNIIVSVHYYSPMEFTHQGADWIPERKGDRPMKWQQSDLIAKEFGAIAEYAQKTNRPINIGEFGVYRSIAPAGDVARWVGDVIGHCRAGGYSYHYWEYNSGFGLFRNGRWDPVLTKVLIP